MCIILECFTLECVSAGVDYGIGEGWLHADMNVFIKMIIQNNIQLKMSTL